MRKPCGKERNNHAQFMPYITRLLPLKSGANTSTVMAEKKKQGEPLWLPNSVGKSVGRGQRHKLKESKLFQGRNTGKAM
jgi:hypothetical protein